MKSVSFNEGKLFFLDAPGGSGKTFETNLNFRGTRAKSCFKIFLIVSLKLCTNMRAHLDGGGADFSIKILLIGDGKVPNSEGKIEIDKELGEIVTNIEDLISKVYVDVVHIEHKNYQWMCERAILAPRNSSVDTINEKIMSKLPGDSVNYLSIDNIMNQE